MLNAMKNADIERLGSYDDLPNKNAFVLIVHILLIMLDEYLRKGGGEGMMKP